MTLCSSTLLETCKEKENLKLILQKARVKYMGEWTGYLWINIKFVSVQKEQHKESPHNVDGGWWQI